MDKIITTKAWLFLIFLFLSACDNNDQLSVITGSTMGTSYTVKTISNRQITKTVIEKRLVAINKTFSTWDDSSELSLFNKAPIKTWINVSDELFLVLLYAKEIYKQTNGYFDVGIGRLIDLWGFGVIKANAKPERLQIQSLSNKISIKHLKLNKNTAYKAKDIHINLSAIAKGYAVDEIARLLKERNINNFLVEIGGEVIASGKNFDKNWTVGIESPNNTKPMVLDLNNAAIATSGNYRNYFIWEGRRYMHILEPKTGFPANSDLASVSVIHPRAMLADAYATAMIAMGSDKARALAEKLDLPAIFIFNKEYNFKTIEINQ